MEKPQGHPSLVENYLKCVNLISIYKSSGILNLEDEKWLTPSQLLVLKNTLSEAKRKGRYVPPKDEKVRGYLGYITSENDTEDSVGGPTYIPFSRITHSNSDSIASKITGMIGNKLNNEPLEALRYSIDELLDNITEHSQYKNSFIMLQNYPSSQILEFSIMDDGISIPGNFRRYGIIFKNDCDSLSKAMNGVSTKDTNGERGFGLHSVFKLLTRGLHGEGVIISGRGILSSKFRNEHEGPLTGLYCYPDDSGETTVFRGCYVAFKVKTDLSPNMYEYLEY